ncbi:OPT superfamily oligopeptide transporter, partial [Atractiella rhizophila]
MDSRLEKNVYEDDKSLDEKAADGVADVQEVAARDIGAIPSDVAEAAEFAKTMSDEEVLEKARFIHEMHGKDPNFPPKAMDLIIRSLNEDLRATDPLAWSELKVEMALITINSPYMEVRAVVDNHDDPNEPCITARTWLIGIVYVAAGAFINQFFSIRFPSIYVNSNVAQILAYPAGAFLARVLPSTVFNTFGYEWSLNPGPFSKKEHMVITIMANVGFNTPYTAYILWVQYPDRFFGQKWALDYGYQITTALSTNFIGYGLAGLTRRFLVYPVISIWPHNLATIALNRAFHERDSSTAVEGGWRVSRMRYFTYCFGGMFVYFWFPNFICESLTYFNWTTWIAPNNKKLAWITGLNTGLGLNPFPSWDWNFQAVDPLVNPFYATVNNFAGKLIAFPVILAVYFTNTFYTSYLPLNSNGVYDNTGKRYNVSRIVNDAGHFDLEAYKQYSPAYLAASQSLVYGFFFAAYTSTITHSILYHRHEIVYGLRNLLRRRSAFADADDIHMKLMSKYKETPEWWYFIVLCVSIGIGAAGIAAYPTHAQPAVVLYGLALALIFCVPIGIIKSITNVEVTLNVLAEFFGGLWFPGDALSMNFFKTYGYVTTAHTLAFAQDLKLAHYSHIPPRITFWCQMIATLASTFVTISIINWQMTSIENVCDPLQKDRFTCPGANTFFTASVLWGTL